VAALRKFLEYELLSLNLIFIEFNSLVSLVPQYTGTHGLIFVVVRL